MLKKFLNTKFLIFMGLIIFVLMTLPKITGLLLILFASYVIAAALNPSVNKLQTKLNNRAVASAITLFLTIFVLFALIIPVIVTCFKEIELLINILPQKLDILHNFLLNTHIKGRTLAQLIPFDNILQSVTSIIQDLLSKSIDFTMAAAQTVFIMLALTMFIFYILVDKQYLRDKFLEFFPPDLREKTGDILYNITSRVGNYVRAQILSMIIAGGMITLMIALIGVDYPILLGLIAAICEIIPLLGPAVALLLIVIVGFHLGIYKVIAIILLFIAIQQISNYVIKPFLFGKFMKLHPINILVAIFIAKQFLGLWGVILSPAIAATICVLVDELYLTPMNRKEQENEFE